MSRPTVYRILRALMDEDFVRQVAAGRYAVGPAFLVIGGSSYGGLRHDMRPFMKDLSNELGETIDLAVLDSGEALFVDQFVAVQGLRVVAHMGARLPLALHGERQGAARGVACRRGRTRAAGDP